MTGSDDLDARQDRWERQVEHHVAYRRGAARSRLLTAYLVFLLALLALVGIAGGWVDLVLAALVGAVIGFDLVRGRRR